MVRPNLNSAIYNNGIATIKVFTILKEATYLIPVFTDNEGNKNISY
jgi:hypothetical protein